METNHLSQVDCRMREWIAGHVHAVVIPKKGNSPDTTTVILKDMFRKFYFNLNISFFIIMQEHIFLLTYLQLYDRRKTIR